MGILVPKSKKFTPPPVPYSVYKRLLGRYNDLYSMWQETITENNDLVKENRELKAKLMGRPTNIRS